MLEGLIDTARVEPYAALYGMARADLFPQASALRQRVSEQGPTPMPASYQVTANSFQAALSAFWELDLWRPRPAGARPNCARSPTTCLSCASRAGPSPMWS